MAELPALHDFAFAEGDNMGGVQAFRLAPYQWFTAVPFPIQGVHIADVTFAGTYTWLTGYATVDSADFSERCEWTDGGPVWRTTFRCFTPCDTIAQRQNIEALARNLLVLDVQDNNGIWRRMGDLVNRARMEYEYTTGDKGSALNGYRLTFTIAAPDPCPVIDADYAPTGPDDSASSGS